MLRPYQQAAHDAVVQHIRLSRDPCVVEAATGAGKSHIIAELAKTIHDISNGKSVLVLQPGEELVKQNHEKYEATGNRASIFSAAVGSISTRFPVVFGTPVSVKNKLSRFGDKFGLIIVDECHGITPTIIHIIDTIRSKNPNVRVVGLTATPYRLGTGYIYKIDEKDKPVPDFQTKDPYFTKLVYRVTARYLLDLGYLTPVTIGRIGSGHYNTAELNGQSFKKDAVDRAYNGHGRLTSEIVADIVAQASDRKGVLLFCATVQHAKEAYASLPPEISAVVDGETDKDMRKSIVVRFKAGKIKYLVSVGVFTTGFDAPHVDIVAMLRLTESPGLLQQIIGRGLRLCDDKTDCLFLDYSENIERHFPDGDVFAPEIRVGMSVGESQPIDCQCPLCDGENLFKARKNPDGYEIDKEGYFVDLRGLRIETDHGPIPAHSGRRCQCLIRDRKTGDYNQCGYRWTFKECPQCQHGNDIAARYCGECKAELVDPNEKLRMEFKQLKRDPTKLQTDIVTDWTVSKTISQRGREQWKIDWQTPYRSFTTWTSSKPDSQYQWRDYELIMAATNGMKDKPKTISYKKEDSGFFKFITFNKEADIDPTA
jgi:DNA repair protein RadD